MSNPYLFYYIMNYPLPLEGEREFLRFDLKRIPNSLEKEFNKIDIRWDLLEELTNQIKKYQYLLKKIPFLKWAFVVNSISFRGVHSNSDIDLFLIVKKNRLWISRLFARRIFRKIKITKKHKYKRFCLSFWIEEDKLNLRSISLLPVDVYLIYWIAHAVPIFSDWWNTNNFYVANKWIQEFLPWWQPKQIINLKIPLLVKKVKGTWSMFDGFWGDVVNGVIYILWRPLMLLKAFWNKEEIGVGTIIKRWMVKIHKDIRGDIIKTIFK